MKASSLLTTIYIIMCIPPKEKNNKSFSAINTTSYSNNWDGKMWFNTDTNVMAINTETDNWSTCRL